MTQIRAFVGHSFTSNDEQVVHKFLEYFDQLSGLDSRFSWEHAAAAEPTQLAQKVMSLLSEKTVFIGICTKKERVIPDASLKEMKFQRSFLKGQKSEFDWKTSDWIIQEIGLAMGKGLELILLLENGVGKPGGLQGDVEYIPFDRAFPEQSFGKITEMITALSPRVSIPSITSPDTISMEAEEEGEPEAPVDDLWKTPQPDWERHNYEMAIFRMILGEDTAGIARIDKAYLETEDAKHSDNRITWEAHREIMHLRFGKGGNLARLMELADAHPDSSGTLIYLAQGYEKYQDYAKAASTYEAAASNATDDTRKSWLMGRAAVNYVRAEMRENSLAIIIKLKARVEETGNGERQLCEVLGELAELAREDEKALAIMERIVDIDPSNINTRFSLSYKHSQIGNKDLALVNYFKIPTQERGSMTWNNLGVAFDHFSLPAKAVDAYRKAAGMGETLSMSNLTKSFMSAGFLPEAQTLCDDALKIRDYHKNVGRDLARLKALPDEEDKKEAELLEKAKPKSAFYRRFGRAACRSDPSELAKRWVGPDCDLEIKLDGDAFSAVGSYERPSLGILMRPFGGERREIDLQRFQVEYSGTLGGRAIEAHVTRALEGATPETLITSGKGKTKVLMVLSDDGSELEVMEGSEGSDPQFYTLKREATDV